MAGRLIDPPRNYRAAPNPPDRSVLVPLGIQFFRDSVAIDYLTHGLGRIEGVSTFDGVPAAARVLLVQDSAKRIVRSAESAADGTYVFEHLATDQTFSVLGEDVEANYNSVIQARITPGIPP